MSGHRINHAVFWAVLLVLAPVAHAGDQEKAPREDERGTYTYVFENDSYRASDGYYSNGAKEGYLWRPSRKRGPEGWIAKTILHENENSVFRRGISLGHSIFTPRNIFATEPLPDDRPYAGWFYGEYTATVENRDSMDQLTLQLGIVGPSAQGEFFQNTYHKLYGAKKVLGWDNQIGDEVGVVLSYDRTLRAVELGDEEFGIEVLPNFGFSAGNIQTNARAGLTLRWGQDLHNDFGPPRVRPAQSGAGFFNPVDDFSWYMFGGFEGRFIAHDIFLDGSLFDKSDPAVAREDFVADWQVGLVVQFWRTQLALSFVERTEEFKAQGKRHRFGTIALSYKY